MEVIPFDEQGRTENWKLHLPKSEGYSRGSRPETHDRHCYISVNKIISLAQNKKQDMKT